MMRKAAKPPRFGLLDLGGATPTRQAERAAAAGDQLVRVGNGIDALLAVQRRQVELLEYLAEMAHRAEERAVQESGRPGRT